MKYESTKKGKVSLLWQPQQLLPTPGAEGRQAWVIIMPVVMVVICADQIALRRLLVMGDQVFVREALERQSENITHESKASTWNMEGAVVLMDGRPPWASREPQGCRPDREEASIRLGGG